MQRCSVQSFPSSVCLDEGTCVVWRDDRVAGHAVELLGDVLQFVLDLSAGALWKDVSVVTRLVVRRPLQKHAAIKAKPFQLGVLVSCGGEGFVVFWLSCFLVVSGGQTTLWA